MIPAEVFPRLTAGNHRRTSPPSPEYNCIAWAANDTEHWWQPGVYWPTNAAPDDSGIDAVERAFRAIGYEDCGIDDSLEPGFEKVALYGNTVFYSHAARQLSSGKWSSKLGKAEDIEYEAPDDVAGGVYGEVVQILKRAVAA
jgi:hypothetical protein